MKRDLTTTKKTIIASLLHSEATTPHTLSTVVVDQMVKDGYLIRIKTNHGFRYEVSESGLEWYNSH